MRTSYYAIVQFEEGRLGWPVFFTCPAGPALLVFTTRGSAERFYHGRDYTPPWELARLRGQDFLVWLRGNRDAGVTRVAVDPGPEDELTQTVDISDFFARLSG